MSTLRETPAPPLDSWPPQACSDADPRLFFPANDNGGRKFVAERQAKAYCGQCLALEQCRAYALPIQDLSGVWGCMNENERARARRKAKEA